MIASPTPGRYAARAAPDAAAEVVLENAAVLTLDQARPTARAVSIRHGRFLSVGSVDAARRDIGAGTRVIDCEGATLMPGFVDPHVHLRSWAARDRSVDCSLASAPSVAVLQERIRLQAARQAPGTWIRAFGYDDSALPDKRHPTRVELDACTTDHPVRLQHRSGHAWVLNTTAATLLVASGVFEGRLERDGDGELTGLLIGGDRSLRDLGSQLETHDTERELSSISAKLLAAGVTFVQDASPEPPGDHLESLLRDAGGPAVRTMIGHRHFLDLTGRPRERMIKVILESDEDAVRAANELDAVVRCAVESGCAVAVHVVDEEMLVLVTDALERARRRGPLPRVRIEHLSVCPPYLRDALAENRVSVVTNPMFVWSSGDRYLNTVDEHLRPWLYPARSLITAGVPVAAASDAPYAEVSVFDSIRAAVTRKTSGGAEIGSNERVSLRRALHMHTRAAAEVAMVADRGLIRPGWRADAVLLDRDVTDVAPNRLSEIQIRQTFVRGVPALRGGWANA